MTEFSQPASAGALPVRLPPEPNVAVKITGISLRRGIPERSGRQLVARVDAVIGPFRFTGAGLYRDPDGTLNAYPPRYPTDRGDGGSVQILDLDLRDRFTAASAAAWQSLAGDADASIETSR